MEHPIVEKRVAGAKGSWADASSSRVLKKCLHGANRWSDNVYKDTVTVSYKVQSDGSFVKKLKLRLPEVPPPDFPYPSIEIMKKHAAEVRKGVALLQREVPVCVNEDSVIGTEREGGLVYSCGNVSEPGTIDLQYGAPNYVGSEVVSACRNIFSKEISVDERFNIFEESLSAAILQRRVGAASVVLNYILNKGVDSESANNETIQQIVHKKSCQRFKKEISQGLEAITENPDLQPGFDYELGREQWETNSAPHSIYGGEAFEKQKRETLLLDCFIEMFSAQFNAAPFRGGTIVSRGPDQFKLDHIVKMTKPRFFLIRDATRLAGDPEDKRFPQEYKKRRRFDISNGADGTSIHIDPGKCEVNICDQRMGTELSFRGSDCIPEAMATSTQFNIDVPSLKDFDCWVNCSYLVNSIIIALSANSYSAYGIPTGFKASRGPVGWRPTIAQLHYDQCMEGEEDTWYSGGPYAELVKIAKRAPILNIQGGANKQTFRESDSPRLRLIKTAVEANSTNWNPVGISYAVDEKTERVKAWIEFRSPCAQPTRVNEEAVDLFLRGLLRALPKFLAENEDFDLSTAVKALEQKFSRKHMRQNDFRAERDALDAKIKWPSRDGSREVSIRDLCVESLVEVAREGLKQLRFTEDQINSYIGSEEHPGGVIWKSLNYEIPEKPRIEFLKKIRARYSDYEREYKGRLGYLRECGRVATQAELHERGLMEDHLKRLNTLAEMVQRKGWCPADVSFFIDQIVEEENPKASRTEITRLVAQYEMVLRAPERNRVGAEFGSGGRFEEPVDIVSAFHQMVPALLSSF